MRCSRPGPYACLVLAGWPVVAPAQTFVTGRVTFEGRPVGGAEIRFEPSGPGTVSQDDGVYTLRAPDAGLVVILARAVGFYPATRRLLLAGGDTTIVNFVLERAPQQIEPVTVEANAPVAIGKMAAFEERRRAGLGRFYTREALARREHATLADVVRMTAGLNLVRRPSECGAGLAVASGRGGSVLWQRWMSCESGMPFPAACYFAVYVDGIRIWAPGSKEPPDINQFTVMSLEGIELYRGPAETPIQYQITGSACGVVLLWTRVGDR